MANEVGGPMEGSVSLIASGVALALLVVRLGALDVAGVAVCGAISAALAGEVAVSTLPFVGVSVLAEWAFLLAGCAD